MVLCCACLPVFDEAHTFHGPSADAFGSSVRAPSPCSFVRSSAQEGKSILVRRSVNCRFDNETNATSFLPSFRTVLRPPTHNKLGQFPARADKACVGKLTPQGQGVLETVKCCQPEISCRRICLGVQSKRILWSPWIRVWGPSVANFLPAWGSTGWYMYQTGGGGTRSALKLWSKPISR